VSVPWSAIGVPIDSVGRAGGTEHAPAALHEHDLLGRLGAEDRGELAVRIRGEERDPATGVIGLADTLATTAAVRAAVRDIVADGRRPLVLGGCCALVPGALAGLRDGAGALGVAYVDGHVDVYDGTTSPTGEGADMPMSVAFGRGPDAWVDAAGGASVAPADVVVLGARDPEEAADIADLRAGTLAALEVLGPAELRAEGLPAAGARAARRLGADGRPFWIHLDLDVLDERAMPATDYLMPHGLEFNELAQLLAPLGSSPALAGLSLGCLNPEKDPDGSYTERTCALLAGALAAR
jgi:arginase